MRRKLLLAPLLALTLGTVARAEGLLLSEREGSDGTTFLDQLKTEAAGPIVLINLFDVAPEDAADFHARWTAAADVLRRKPGFVNTTLHRAVGASRLWLNRAEWQSLQDFRAAMRADDFLAIAKTMKQQGFRRIYTAEPTQGPLSFP